MSEFVRVNLYLCFVAQSLYHNLDALNIQRVTTSVHEEMVTIAPAIDDDTDKITASYDDGVLEVALPRAEEAGVKKIEAKAKPKASGKPKATLRPKAKAEAAK